MDKVYVDEMTIYSIVGFPDLFVSFTCNLKWPEIVRLLEKHHLTPFYRPGILARVFRIKFEELISYLTKKHLLSRVIACK